MPEEPKTWLDTASQAHPLVLAAVTSFVGGIGATWSFIKSRDYFTQLETSLTTNFTDKNGVDYLLVSLLVKNTGKTNAEFLRGQHTLVVEACVPKTNAQDFEQATWKEVSLLLIFASQDNIEPSETICEDALIVVPKTGELALRITSEVRAQKSPAKGLRFKHIGGLRFRRDIPYHTWACRKVVYMP